MKSLRIDPWLILAYLLFLFILLPHGTSVPYLDGNIDFVQSHDFFSGGFHTLAENWGSLHPPLKVGIISIFFHVFGIHTWAYVLPGILFGLLGIGAMYMVAHELFGQKTARIAALLLATAPLFISVGLFFLTDYLLTVFVLLVLAAYVKKQYLWSGIFLIFAVLTKETAVLLPVSILLVARWKNIRATMAAGVSLLVYAAWTSYLHSIGQKPWSDWIFAETAGRGATFTIIHNLTTGAFFNPYAIQNWLHLFVLNYQWIYSLGAIAGSMYAIRKRMPPALLVYVLFSFFYAISVLSFQTYTIPRYVLPVVPFLLLLFAYAIDRSVHTWQFLRIPIFMCIVIIGLFALFTSTDPLSRVIWGDMTWMGQRLYNLRDHLSGNDGITYNAQYLAIVHERTKRIEYAQQQGTSLVSRDCGFVFPDPNNEKKMLVFLRFTGIPKDRWCVAQ